MWVTGTLLGQVSCVGNLDTAWTGFLCRYVTWTLPGQVSCVGNMDTAWTGFLCR